MTRHPSAGLSGVLALAAAILLGGCSFFSHSVTWTKSGATEAQAQSDLAQCTEEAKTQTDRDKGIDQDIAATNNGANAGLDTSPIQNMDAYRNERRFKSILGDCMTQLGYREAQ